MDRWQVRSRITAVRRAAIKVLKENGIVFHNAPSNYELAVLLIKIKGMNDIHISKNKKVLREFFDNCIESGLLVLASKESKSFYSSLEWKKLRYEAFKLYGNRCMACGATPSADAVLNVDHIKPRSKHPELALDIRNLQILCAKCNWGKLDKDQTDWRVTTLE